MRITVRTDEHTIDQHENAKSWVIDEKGRLHITKQSGGNSASYDRGHWTSVFEAAPNPTE